MNGRERILALLEGRRPDRLPFMPITMMFAAKLAGIPYLKYATDFRCLVEGQLRLAEVFDVDYVNTMSDPAGEAADCGAPVKFFSDQPPALDETRALLADKTKLKGLRVPDPSTGPRMHNRLQALELYRRKVGRDKLIEGWIEGPIAQAADLRGINAVMLDFYDDPDFIRELFEFVLELEIRFAKAQVEAGADMIGIGDAAASLVGPRIYEEFVWPCEKRMVDGLKALGTRVRLHVCGATRPLLKRFGELGCDVVDLDSQAPLSDGRLHMGDDQVLLGNIDPVRVLCNGDPDSIYEAVAECHQAAGPRFIVSAGCEVPRDTPHENLHAMRRYTREHAASHAPATGGRAEA
ncbi:MAG: uroporphyrinogen decarboxylase family protein [Planctomycetota bacterium]|nr:uroporphyrinogen decarboxylase family protein [Planctomycetota bacterium]